jgi:hypothetical protein
MRVYYPWINIGWHYYQEHGVLHNEEHLLGVQRVYECKIKYFILREFDILVSMTIENLIYTHG